MKLFIKFGLVLLTISLCHAQQQCPLIPAPMHAGYTEDVFKLNRQTALFVDEEHLKNVGRYLQQELLRLKGFPLMAKSSLDQQSSIRLKLDEQLAEEAYELNIAQDGIIISGGSAAGVFNGASSLVQLISQVESMAEAVLPVPCWTIKDEPRYGWRGLMLDESRYFIGKQKLLSIIDWMAFYKLNKLHWHLTDEPAWRLEIKKYPRLALVGGVGDQHDKTKPAAFYTQQEISEIVDYASKRNIEIIPEIDMPGHATAANRAYPAYSGGGSEQYPEFTFDPGNPETYTYLTNILREANALFPSNMLHLGGDEVSFGNDSWLQNAGVKRLMHDHRLKDLKAVENYFMERMADSVYQMHAKLLVWDEMADINLPKDKTVIFWWRHDKPQQLYQSLKKGYETVLCPRLPFYFDFVQDSSHQAGRKWGGLYSPLQDVYHFDADTWVKDDKQRQQVLGLQANLWTETVTNNQRVDYLLFPRLAALAESAWSADAVKSYAQFEERLKRHLKLYRQHDVYFYNPFHPNEIPEPVYFKKDKKDLNAEEN
ncbi:beta-N-acetylhexosaminidase [Olivibacter sp. SDN3]|nr:beta-N-acetylhexosaminidase [Olivibacter sp. SDN3]